MEIGNACVKETTTRPDKNRNGSSIQRENHAPKGVLQQAPKQKCVLVTKNV